MIGARRPHLLLVIRLGAQVGIAGLFVWAGLEKMRTPAALAEDIGHYQLVPSALIPVLATLIPAFEIVAGGALLVPHLARGAAAIAAALLGTFALAMLQAKLRGIDLACGCFGAESEAQVTWLSVLRNLGLCGLAVWLASPWNGALHQSALPSPSE